MSASNYGFETLSVHAGAAPDPGRAPTEAELDEMREMLAQIVSTPAAAFVAQHAAQLHELALVHLSTAAERGRDALIQAEPLQAGGGENNRIVFAIIELAQAGLHIAAQGLDFQMRITGTQLGFAAQARRAHHRARRQIFKPRIMVVASSMEGSLTKTG